jgi:hypothetical protein
MDTTQLSTILGLLAALSVASERLVEIIKGFVPGLDKHWSTPGWETARHAILNFIAAIAGMLTAYVAREAFPTTLHLPSGFLTYVVLGLLASGGSGFWNSIQDYVNNAKNLKGRQAKKA